MGSTDIFGVGRGRCHSVLAERHRNRSVTLQREPQCDHHRQNGSPAVHNSSIGAIGKLFQTSEPEKGGKVPHTFVQSVDFPVQPLRELSDNVANQKRRIRQRGWGRIETVILAISVAGLGWLFLWPGDPFSHVSIGMSRAEAIAMVGTPPRKEDKTLPFCHEGAPAYQDCEKIKKSGAVYFLLWKVGIGSWMVVGLDANDKVCFRGRVNT